MYSSPLGCKWCQYLQFRNGMIPRVQQRHGMWTHRQTQALLAVQISCQQTVVRSSDATESRVKQCIDALPSQLCVAYVLFIHFHWLGRTWWKRRQFELSTSIVAARWTSHHLNEVQITLSHAHLVHDKLNVFKAVCTSEFESPPGWGRGVAVLDGR